MRFLSLKVMGIMLVFGVIWQSIAQEKLNFMLNVSWSPNGQWIAGLDTDGVLWLWDTTTKQPLMMEDLGSTQHDIAWNSDGSRFATVGQDQTLRVWDAATHNLLGSSTYNLPYAPILAIAWSPDDTRIITGGYSLITVWDADKIIPNTQFNTGDTYDLAWSPDGQSIAFATFNGLSIVPISALNSVGVFQNNLLKTPSFLSVAWHPYQPQLAAAGDDGKLYIVDAQNQIVLMVLEAYTDLGAGMVWSPDGESVAVYGMDGRITIWDIDTGALAVEYQGNSGQLSFGMSFSPYGGQFAYGHVLDTASSDDIVALGSVQIVVPAPSLERLHAVADLCTRRASVSMSAQDLLKTNTVTTLTVDDLPNFITQIERLPTDAIPPACAADLIAVAEAIIAQP
jgi:WD40 repeat protein